MFEGFDVGRAVITMARILEIGDMDEQAILDALEDIGNRRLRHHAPSPEELSVIAAVTRKRGTKQVFDIALDVRYASGFPIGTEGEPTLRKRDRGPINVWISLVLKALFAETRLAPFPQAADDRAKRRKAVKWHSRHVVRGRPSTATLPVDGSHQPLAAGI